MKDCAVLFSVAGREYGLLFDFDAYLALERRHGLSIGAFSRGLTDVSVVAAQAGMLEGLEGYRRAFNHSLPPHTPPEAGALVFELGCIEACPLLAQALAATYRREKGIRKDAEKKAPEPQKTS